MSLEKEQDKQQLTLLDTIRQNRKELLKEFVTTKGRGINSHYFDLEIHLIQNLEYIIYILRKYNYNNQKV